MNAVRAESERDVNAVINNKLHTARARHAQGRFGLLEKGARFFLLFTQLDNSRTASTQAFDLPGVCES
jgi:hypothetical protein